jgi:uncharacterized repeat protein (TIGR03803 family)
VHAWQPYSLWQRRLAARAQTLTNLYNFHGPDGERPQANLTQGTGGNFYAAAYSGGLQLKHGGAGTLFRISPAGDFTLLHQFCSAANCNDGVGPSQLVQAPNGFFYGTTYIGGTGLTSECLAYPGCGTLFSRSARMGH